MYMAYGWLQVIPLLAGSCPSSQRVVYLKLAGRLLLVVSPSHLELCGSSHQRVRLGKYMIDEKSVREEGENLQAVWSPDSKLITVLIEFRWKVVPTSRQSQLSYLEKKQLSVNDARLSGAPPPSRWKKKIDSPVVEAHLNGKKRKECSEPMKNVSKINSDEDISLRFSF